MEKNSETVVEKENINNKKKNVIFIAIAILVIAIIAVILAFSLLKEKDKTTKKVEDKVEEKRLEYTLSGNSLEDFDLSFLQLENDKKNKVYSPLSIKYALEMLNEGANGETKEQISSILGKYTSKKYTNSKNISLANALFIKDSYKAGIKNDYIEALNKYNAEVIYDSFATPDKLNSWVSDKTFNLINNLSDDISSLDFILVNALAIDMEWVNKIQSKDQFYGVSYDHIDYSKHIGPLEISDYTGLNFKDLSYEAKSAEIGAVINKYDIVKDIGEDKIKETVGTEYKKWLADGAPNSCDGIKSELDVDSYLNKYIKEISKGYKDISSSTDFSFYVDDNVKVFAKDLKKYDNTTLQYIGIMPIKDSLDNYIKNVKASDINTLIDSLKPIELSSFKDGVITEIKGYIPMFKMDYELNLMDDLKKLGVTNVFNSNKADLSNLSTNKGSFISDVAHKTNIEFSNDGIKASAAVSLGGAGAANCGFDYLYEVPVEVIDLTFDSPYLFIIRDKDSGEVWFIGTVYEPVKYQSADEY